MDHFAVRYPTNVSDIGKFLLRLIGELLQSRAFGHQRAWTTGLRVKELPKILHFSAPEPYTKYEITLLLASILGLDHQHIVPDDDDPSLRGEAVARPRDCKLDTTETELLLDGVPGGVLGCVGFEEWWRQELGKK
jgi:S-adenosylmethionine synthetase